jgi:HPt (histidine-containing phosphotransfer) domain-containing protein
MSTINLEKALRLMDGDEELFSDLFDIIQGSLPEKYRNLEAAIEAQSAEDLELYAHQFKGAMRNVAAEDACALLEKLEKCGPRKEFELARELYPQVKPLVDELLNYYRSRAWAAAFVKSKP